MLHTCRGGWPRVLHSVVFCVAVCRVFQVVCMWGEEWGEGGGGRNLQVNKPNHFFFNSILAFFADSYPFLVFDSISLIISVWSLPLSHVTWLLTICGTEGVKEGGGGGRRWWISLLGCNLTPALSVSPPEALLRSFVKTRLFGDRKRRGRAGKRAVRSLPVSSCHLYMCTRGSVWGILKCFYEGLSRTSCLIASLLIWVRRLWLARRHREGETLRGRSFLCTLPLCEATAEGPAGEENAFAPFTPLTPPQDSTLNHLSHDPTRSYWSPWLEPPLVWPCVCVGGGVGMFWQELTQKIRGYQEKIASLHSKCKMLTVKAKHATMLLTVSEVEGLSDGVEELSDEELHNVVPNSSSDASKQLPAHPSVVMVSDGAALSDTRNPRDTDVHSVPSSCFIVEIWLLFLYEW